MEEQKDKKKKIFFIVGPLVLFIALVGITYSFFNYTRTGSENTFRTGRIYFNATEGDTVTLSDLFPITASGEITSATSGVGAVVLHITGDTTYTDGIEYLVKSVNVRGLNGTSLPISIEISYSATSGEGNVIGQADDNYFTNRGGNSSVYKVLTNDTIKENGDLLVGYIAPGVTGIDGELTILAYLDAQNIAITDTLVGTEEASAEYENGTTGVGENTWVNGRTVLTTEEWNALQQNGVSFQIKVVANEGTWVEEPGKIPSCPGCKFIFTTNEYFYSANNYKSSPVSTLTTFEENNETLVDDYTTLNKNYFLGFKFDGSGNITNAYACGIKRTDYLNNEEQNPGVNAGTPFCIEGSTDGSTYQTNKTFLGDSTTGIWRGRCIDSGSNIVCPGLVSAYAYDTGYTLVSNSGGNCFIANHGNADCS